MKHCLPTDLYKLIKSITAQKGYFKNNTKKTKTKAILKISMPNIKAMSFVHSKINK